MFHSLHSDSYVKLRGEKETNQEEMGCTSAKQVTAVPNSEEDNSKAYSNGDLHSGQLKPSVFICHFS